jgi:hypothetical protein
VLAQVPDFWQFLFPATCQEDFPTREFLGSVEAIDSYFQKNVERKRAAVKMGKF